ncbi:TetR family transcriptional regulator [Sphingomonas sp. Leaf33]|uniref:TetR/AcrR family transcriptional regulator n=1 Tax=Sphingomonas sp. Leaf33 TaxID=1736215 RepID=UPI0006FDA524|nr:TetR family transcriptional regulator [Sphingomonas sp. Leaf33]KQN26075.1 TetR family transcriptional regulator [Sphingomonas sp. Leaf33]
MTATVTRERGTKRFQAKRDAILAAAAEAINDQSAKGMTFADVAARVGLNTTSVTYYFRRKEDLASACFEHTIDQLGAMLDDAMEEPTPERRVARYLAINFQRMGRIARGEETAFAILSDLRAMDEPIKGKLLTGWQRVFRNTRALWGEPTDRTAKDLNGARAHVLLENTFWLSIWLTRYDVDEYDRVESRLMDVFRHGLAGRAARWTPHLLEVDDSDQEPGRAAFLTAATRLINELGYRGASVQKIASELNVTKGSFYHHLDAKDELVTECYRRSFDRIAAAQASAHSAGGTYWQMLENVMATLLDIQFSERGPLLRTTALSGLPPRDRQTMIDRSNRLARRFAGMISDGIAEGSIRAVDPLVASQALMAIQNAAFDMRKWASTMPRERAVAMYASTLMFGLFDDRVIA